MAEMDNTADVQKTCAWRKLVAYWRAAPSSERVSVMAMLVALFSLSLSVIQGCQTIRYAQFSMRPSVTVYDERKADQGGLYVYNAGQGPAVVKSFRYLVNGKELTTPDLLRELSQRCRQAGFSPELDIRKLGQNQPIRHDKEYPLIVAPQSLSVAEYVNLMRVLQGIEIRISYRAVYPQWRHLQYKQSWVPETEASVTSG